MKRYCTIRRFCEIMLAVVAFFTITAPAYAFGFDTVKGWFSGGIESIALGLLGVVLGIGIVKAWTRYASTVFTAIGTFFVTLGGIFASTGAALSDNSINKDEIAAFKASVAQLRTDFSAMVTAFKSKTSSTATDTTTT